MKVVWHGALGLFTGPRNMTVLSMCFTKNKTCTTFLRSMTIIVQRTGAWWLARFGG